MISLKQTANQYGIAHSQQATASSLRQRRLQRTNAPDMRSRSRSIKKQQQLQNRPEQSPRIRYIHTLKEEQPVEPEGHKYGYLVRSLNRCQSENKPSLRGNTMSNVTFEFQPFGQNAGRADRGIRDKQNEESSKNTIAYYEKLYLSTKNQLKNTLVAVENQKEVIAHLSEKIRKLTMMLEEKQKIIVMKQVQIGQMFNKINMIKIKQKQRMDSQRSHQQSLSKDKNRTINGNNLSLQATIGTLQSKVKTQQGYISILREQIYKLKIQCSKKSLTGNKITQINNRLDNIQSYDKKMQEEQDKSLILQISLD